MKRNELVAQLLQNRRIVFGFIYVLCRDVEIAEEIFQEVSIAVLEEAARQGEVDRFLPWVFQIARHRSSEHFRQRRRREPLSAVLADAVSAVFDENEETREEAARRIRGLLDCVEDLPDRQREIVELQYRQRLPIQRIAEKIRWKEDAVKVSLSKVRKSLLECLRGKRLVGEAEIS